MSRLNGDHIQNAIFKQLNMLERLFKSVGKRRTGKEKCKNFYERERERVRLPVGFEFLS
jgi:hypothetical protein